MAVTLLWWLGLEVHDGSGEGETDGTGGDGGVVEEIDGLMAELQMVEERIGRLVAAEAQAAAEEVAMAEAAAERAAEAEAAAAEMEGGSRSVRFAETAASSSATPVRGKSVDVSGADSPSGKEYPATPFPDAGDATAFPRSSSVDVSGADSPSGKEYPATPFPDAGDATVFPRSSSVDVSGADSPSGKEYPATPFPDAGDATAFPRSSSVDVSGADSPSGNEYPATLVPNANESEENRSPDTPSAGALSPDELATEMLLGAGATPTKVQTSKTRPENQTPLRTPLRPTPRPFIFAQRSLGRSPRSPWELPPFQPSPAKTPVLPAWDAHVPTSSYDASASYATPKRPSRVAVDADVGDDALYQLGTPMVTPSSARHARYAYTPAKLQSARKPAIALDPSLMASISSLPIDEPDSLFAL
ncbi:uncharacterized protein AMSG_01932 [Thecamonas trahens ATCC 50062]|uniref:Uncharacterized protein n=1 Tax=Thecamonas trahens ATCC 50062 TaxID=461836 RepID=A0A0L0DUD3_THETB|nr:hypothetical protein AMSG_01932 [Thecamonas trahens ATCC 50062]KNC55661.1 hypothetical protein AMSG_01932 [Thecamonas trahens ATCC 50062]|eukprot:XP_013761430.1 hypothetical protein AMSG_01932 [Thecamonas trahens ATCC 50062]